MARRGIALVLAILVVGKLAIVGNHPVVSAYLGKNGRRHNGGNGRIGRDDGSRGSGEARGAIAIDDGHNGKCGRGERIAHCGYRIEARYAHHQRMRSLHGEHGCLQHIEAIDFEMTCPADCPPIGVAYDGIMEAGAGLWGKFFGIA